MTIQIAGLIHIGLLATVVCVGFVAAAGAELRVYAPGGVRSALQGAAAAFERETQHKIQFTFGTGGGIQKQVAAGAPADITVIPSSGVSELEKMGLTTPGSRMEVGSVGVGVGIKAGSPRPAIGTPDELRATLLAAKSVTYADPARGGTSGTYFEKVVLPKLGIVEQVLKKAALTGVGEEAVKRVANGESEIVVVQSSEIVSRPRRRAGGPAAAGSAESHSLCCRGTEIQQGARGGASLRSLSHFAFGKSGIQGRRFRIVSKQQTLALLHTLLLLRRVSRSLCWRLADGTPAS